MSSELTTANFRTGSGVTEDVPWTAVDSVMLAGAVPWRTFRWYNGQQHYSGSYWSVTMGGHVVYESRLELSRLIFADFDRSVRHILAQPFLLKCKADGKVRRHIPDYFLVTDDGPVVVDVKPRRLLARPKVSYTFDWTRRLVEERGWRFQVWSEPRPHELENLRFLAGYRRPWLFDAGLLDQVRGADVEGRSLGEVVLGLAGRDPAAARAAVLHLLWRGELTTDLSTPLSSTHCLARPA